MTERSLSEWHCHFKYWGAQYRGDLQKFWPGQRLQGDERKCKARTGDEIQPEVTVEGRTEAELVGFTSSMLILVL